jgi:ABC-type branched-subunit amino acid transport system ATPase component
VGNITVFDNASITINSGRSLAVCGNWTGGTTTASTVTGAGKVILTGATAQTLSGRTSFSTLHVTKTTGTTATMQAGSAFDVSTAVELESGTLATGSGTLTFKSTSYYSNCGVR